jgi:hypothetical protein
MPADFTHQGRRVLALIGSSLYAKVCMFAKMFSEHLKQSFGVWINQTKCGLRKVLGLGYFNNEYKYNSGYIYYKVRYKKNYKKEIVLYF